MVKFEKIISLLYLFIHRTAHHTYGSGYLLLVLVGNQNRQREQISIYGFPAASMKEVRALAVVAVVPKVTHAVLQNPKNTTLWVG